MQQKTNQDILTDFLLEHRESYYRIAYSYVRNQEDALDIVQESICKALTGSNKINNTSAIKSWFYRIVVNTSIDYIKKNKKYVYVEDEELEIIGPTKWDHYEDYDLLAALDQLPTKHKTVVTLHYFEDMTFEDIAKVLNENVNTIKSRFYSSLKKLRLELEDRK